jgi:hypothetical protein
MRGGDGLGDPDGLLETDVGGQVEMLGGAGVRGAFTHRFYGRCSVDRTRPDGDAIGSTRGATDRSRARRLATGGRVDQRSTNRVRERSQGRMPGLGTESPRFARGGADSAAHLPGMDSTTPTLSGLQPLLSIE